MGRLKEEIRLLGKAELSASIASIVDFGLVFILIEADWLRYHWANIIGVVSGGIVNCCINYRYVFNTNGRKKKSVAWRYLLVWLVSFFFNGFGTNFITRLLGERYFIFIKATVACCVAIGFNYPAQKRFVFKGAKQSPATDRYTITNQ